MFLNNNSVMLIEHMTINKLFDNKCYLKYKSFFNENNTN